LGEEGARRVPLFIEADVAHRLFHYAYLVFVVVYHEVPGIAYLLGVLAQYPRSKRVKRTDRQLLGTQPYQLFEAGLHLLRGLVGEGHCAYAAGPHSLGFYKVSYTV